MKQIVFLILIISSTASVCLAQWTNRYPKLKNMGHHVYLEGFELPIMNAGPTDPACSPRDGSIAFAAKGWLWVMNMTNLEATKITSSEDIDSSPSWSPSGDQIVFVRDNGRDTKIMLLQLDDLKESTLIDTDAIELDPSFSDDGQFVFFASADSGTFDLWKIHLPSKKQSLVTSEDGQERLPVTKDNQVFYLKKRGRSFDSIEKLDPEKNTSTTLVREYIASQTSFAIAPDGNTMAYTWPDEDDYELRVLDIDNPASTMLLTRSEGLPMMPAYSNDGKYIYYSENSKNQSALLKRISVDGGQPETIRVKRWHWGSATGTLNIITRINGEKAPVRLNVTLYGGHPVVPDAGTIRSEGQNGRIFFYSPGEITLESVPGQIEVMAVHGFETPTVTQKIDLKAGQEQEIVMDLQPVWNPQANGWYAGDNHFHLNYGGTYRLSPEDISLDLEGEGLDIAYPLLANLHNRYLEQDLWGWQSDTGPIIQFGQEIRSHFLGHLGLIGTDSLYWPWIWGPFYELYSNDDRLNTDPLQFTRRQNGLGSYVHPVSIREPFEAEGARAIPVSLIADCVLGEVDLIEVACLWTDEIGTASVWHQILNLGIPVMPSAGSDVMNDYYRTMAIGAARVYVKPDEPFNESNYLKVLKSGQSFVTTGPLLEFTVDENGPGGIIETDRKKVKWQLEVHSAVPYEKVELFVNDQVVWSGSGNSKSGSIDFNGSVKVPEGGWITARISGGNSIWPMMESYPFAESAPIWFHEKGSIDQEAAATSAQKLLQALEVSDQLLSMGYEDNPIPKLKAHFQEARDRLKTFIDK